MNKTSALRRGWACALTAATLSLTVLGTPSSATTASPEDAGAVTSRLLTTGAGTVSGNDFLVDPDAEPLKRAGDGQINGRSNGKGAVASKSTSAAVSSFVNRYDVHVIAVNTRVGNHETSAAESQAVVKRLDEEYDRETGGAYRFTYGSFQSLTVSTASCGVDYWNTRLTTQINALKASQGATDALWVVVAAGNCRYAGQAWVNAPGVHMLPAHWNAVGAEVETRRWRGLLDVNVLAHEVGHNLGLDHASGVEETATGAFPGTTFYEYGSPYSVMGDNRGPVRFNPMELAQLGLLPRSRTVTATAASQTFRIAPMRSTTGVTTVVVPVGSSAHTVISYRDGLGQDWTARHGSAAPYAAECGYNATFFGGEFSLDDPAEICESELVERNDALLKDSGYTAWVRRHNVGVAIESTYATASSQNREDVLPLVLARPAGAGVYANERQGYVAGESVALRNGVTVKVLAVDAEGATVKVNRRADSAAPLFGTHDTSSVCSMLSASVTKGSTCLVESTRGKATSVVSIAGNTWDDTAVVAAGVDVDGKTVKRTEWSADRPHSYQGETDVHAQVTLADGTHTVSRWIKDTAGKVSRRTANVVVAPSATPTKVRTLKASKIKKTSARLTWTAPTTAPGGVTDYTVKLTWRTAKGKTKKLTYKDGVSAKTGVSLTKLARRTKYTATIQAVTPFGRSNATKVVFTTKR